MVTMAPFLRIGFSAYDVGVLPSLSDPPICAIKMKESVNTGMYKCNCTHVPISVVSLVSLITPRPNGAFSRCLFCVNKLNAVLFCVFSMQVACFIDAIVNLTLQSEERLWSRESPLCILPGNLRLMLTLTRAVFLKFS